MVARLAAAALLAVGVAGCGGGDRRLSLPPGEHFAVSASISPRTSGFGDTLTARIRILMDRNRIDPDSVKVQYRFNPYRDRPSVERVDTGNLTALLYTVQLECLTISCVPPEGGLSSDFWEVRVTSGDGPVRSLVLPEVFITSRVGSERDFVPENAGESPDPWPPRWRAAVSLPDPTYRGSPELLVWLLALAGLALVAGSAFAGVRLLRTGRLLRAPAVTPLDRALALLREARTDEERRAALEALALAVEGETAPDLVEPARELAWSPGDPSADAAEQLASLAEGGR